MGEEQGAPGWLGIRDWLTGHSMFLVKQSIYRDVKVKCPFPEVTSWAGAAPSWGLETYSNISNLMWEALLSLPFADRNMKAWGEKNHFSKITDYRARGLQLQIFLWPVRSFIFSPLLLLAFTHG